MLSGIGSVIGLSLFFISLQVYFDSQYLLSDDTEIINDEFLVLKKDITQLSIIGIGKNLFNDKEINDLKKQSFVNNLAVFKSCKYQVYAHLGSKGGSFPGFKTLAFFESIPSKFIDTPINEWKWDISSETVPIILPTTFVDAYNYGIALSMGTPQISKKLLKTVPLKLKLVETINHILIMEK